MNRNSLKKYMLYFILLIPFFEPAYINVRFNILDKIYEILLALSCIIIFCISLKKMYISKYTLITIIFESFVIFFCIINNNLSKNVILNAIKIIAITLLVNYGMKYSCKEMLKAIIFILEILIIINFATIVIFPDGMYINEVSGMKDNWFLGMDNIHVLYFMPFLMCLYIYHQLYEKITVTNIISIICCILSILIRWSATTVVGIALICVYIIFEKYISKTKIFNMHTYIISYIVIYFGIIIFKIQEKFAFFIENVLKKDVTFTKRTQIWDYTINFIEDKILTGYGIEDNTVRLQKISVVHGHNIFLEVTYQGGIILLFVFITMIYEVLKKLQKQCEYKLARVLMFIIFTFFIMMITEAYNMFNIIFILSICNCIDTFLKEKKEWSNKCKEPKRV